MRDLILLLLALVGLFIFAAAPAQARHAIRALKKHPDKKIAKKQNADREKNTSDPGVFLPQPYEQMKILGAPLFHGCDDPFFSRKSWRPGADSNRCTRICNPLDSLSPTGPRGGQGRLISSVPMPVNIPNSSLEM